MNASKAKQIVAILFCETFVTLGRAINQIKGSNNG